MDLVYSNLSIMVCGATWIASIVKPASFERVLCHYVLRLSASLMTELISGAAREAHSERIFNPPYSPTCSGRGISDDVACMKVYSMRSDDSGTTNPTE
jgi:hypothetical protein